MSDSSVTNARSTEDLVMASLRSYFACREYHAPLPCYRRDDQGECVLRPMLERWKNYDAPTPIDEHPQVFALSQAGCFRNRAKMILRQEGVGMEDISCVVAAYISQKHQEREVLPTNIGICSQCKPGTNTYAWKKSSFLDIRACHRISINLSESTKHLESNSTKVLRLGRGGKLQFCGPGDFMTVSHVWEHGWQGVAEDGICSRLLDALLTTAASFGLEWVWLDIAMICRGPYARAMSVNRMNLVYTNAKITLVCDRLLLSMQGGSDREKVLALAASDWMTRVWTMQEALLSTRSRKAKVEDQAQRLPV